MEIIDDASEKDVDWLNRQIEEENPRKLQWHKWNKRKSVNDGSGGERIITAIGETKTYTKPQDNDGYKSSRKRKDGDKVGDVVEHY